MPGTLYLKGIRLLARRQRIRNAVNVAMELFILALVGVALAVALVESF